MDLGNKNLFYLGMNKLSFSISIYFGKNPLSAFVKNKTKAYSTVFQCISFYPSILAFTKISFHFRDPIRFPFTVFLLRLSKPLEYHKGNFKSE